MEARCARQHVDVFQPSECYLKYQFENKAEQVNEQLTVITFL